MLRVTKESIKEVQEILSGVNYLEDKENKSITLFIKVWSIYGTEKNLCVGRIKVYEKNDFYIYGIGKNGKEKEYKTIRGVVNFLLKEYTTCISKEVLEKKIAELQATKEEPKETMFTYEEMNDMYKQAMKKRGKKMEVASVTDNVEKSENKSIQFHPQATAIKKGNSYSAKMLIEDIKSTKEKILDYGLGIGRNLEYIADNTNLKLFGVDIMEQIEKEKANHDKLRSQGHIIEPTEKNNLKGFDKILNSHVLNVVDSDEVKKFIVADIYDKLNEGGKAYIEVRTKADVESAKTKEKYKDGYKIKKGSVYTYQEGITKEKMLNLVTSVGFKVNQHIYNSSKHIIVCEK